MMQKRILAGALLALLLSQSALAEVFTGYTAATQSLSIQAPASGILESLSALPGETVSAGSVLGQLRTTKIFAAQNGTVTRILATEGQQTEGGVLEIAPESLYTIYCTAEKAHDTAANQLIHSGETLYMQCTKNETHQGMGVVAQVEGSEYRVNATGGEFYVGETVYLYRDAECSYAQWVGTGTVISTAPESYEAAGLLARIHVKEGEAVERGELLYEIIDGESAQLIAPIDGIITAISAQQGATIAEDQPILTLSPLSSLCVEIQVEENFASRIRPGYKATLTYTTDPNETPISGIVSEILQIPTDGLYTIRIHPEAPIARIGQSVSVHIGEE